MTSIITNLMVPIPQKPFALSSSSTMFCRDTLSHLIDSLVSCVQEKNLDELRSYLAPNIKYNAEGRRVNGVDDAITFISSILSEFSSIQYFVKRKIIDEERGSVAIEAITRSLPSSSTLSPSCLRPSSPVCSSSSPSPSSSPDRSSSPSSLSGRSTPPRPVSPSSLITERQVAWIFKINKDGKVREWKTWKDPIWHVTLTDGNTPLPKEVWSRSSTPSFESRSDVEELLIRNSDLYAKNEMKTWEKECAHKDLIMHPPWDTLLGVDCCLKAARVFHSEYKDTLITPVSIVYDITQPGVVAYHQLFQTTNRFSNKIGQDEDYVFLEVVEGKIRYWRTYFDTDASSQTTDQTFKHKVISASLGSASR